MEIKMLGEDRYVIKPDAEKNTKTKTGIIIETSDEGRAYKTGVITHVGEGRHTETGARLTQVWMTGEQVMYEPRNQIEVMINGIPHIIIRQSNIIGSYTN